METIELFGVPRIGKSLIKSYILSQSSYANFLNYRSVIAKYLYDKKKISFSELSFLNHVEYCRENSRNKNPINVIQIFCKNIFFLILPINKTKLRKELDILIRETEKKNKGFFSYIKKIGLNKKKDLNKIIFWIKEEMTGLRLYQKYRKKYICLNSEGILQRIISLIVRNNLSKIQIKKILDFFPKLDLIIILRNKNIENELIREFLYLRKSDIDCEDFKNNYLYSISQIKKKFKHKVININDSNYLKDINKLTRSIL